MVRVAIIGLGAVTRNIHLPAYARLKGQIEVVAGCDPDGAARVSALNKGHLPAVYTDAEEMIEKTKPDIVSICTPPALHHQQTLMALGAGCHVFCEKPLAESLSDADAMIEAARQAKRFVVVNNQFPYMNIHQASKDLIGSPEFGRLLYLHAWQTFRPTESTEADWRGRMQRRLCFEFGIHVFELIRFFFAAEPLRIFSHMPRPDPKRNVESINVTSVEFADGRAASIVLDRLSKGPERYLDMRLDGEHASIHTSIGGELRVKVGLHTRERKPYFGINVVKGGKAVLQNGNKTKIFATDGINPFASSTAVHFANFVEAIKNGGTPRGTIEDNRQTLALVFAAYDSAELGRAVEMRRYSPLSERHNQTEEDSLVMKAG